MFENSSTDPNAKFAEVIIPADFMSTNNRRVKTRQLWGDGTYTSDSDIVAVLMHLGYYSNYLSYPPGPVQEFRALLKLLPSQEKYPSKARFVKSRTWASKTHTCAYIVESCWAVMKGGPGHLVELHSQLDEIPAICPTARAAVQRQINTRKSGGKSGTEVSVQFNLCNEPWLKYTLPAIADRGLKAPQWTSSRFQEEVLMLETDSQRFQVAKTGETTSPDGTARDVFSLSRCKRPLPLGMMLKAGLPLPADHVEVIESALGWEEFQWGIGALAVKGTTLNLRRMQFLNRV